MGSEMCIRDSKKRESPIDVSYLDLRPIVMLNGEEVDFNDIISPSRVITIINPSLLILNERVIYYHLFL